MVYFLTKRKKDCQVSMKIDWRGGGGVVAVKIHCQKKQCHILCLKDKERKRKEKIPQGRLPGNCGVLFALLFQCFKATLGN